MQVKVGLSVFLETDTYPVIIDEENAFKEFTSVDTSSNDDRIQLTLTAGIRTITLKSNGTWEC